MCRRHHTSQPGQIKKINRTLNFSWSIVHSWNSCKFAPPFAKKLLHKISIFTPYSQITYPYYQRKKDRKNIPIHHNWNSSLSMLLTTNKFSSNIDDDKPPIHVETAEKDGSPITSPAQWGRGAMTASAYPPYRCQIHTRCRGTLSTWPWTSPHSCCAWSSRTARPSAAPSARNPWSHWSASAWWPTPGFRTLSSTTTTRRVCKRPSPTTDMAHSNPRFCWCTQRELGHEGVREFWGFRF